MKDLKITHILNVSDMIPNHFEDSSTFDKSHSLESLRIQYLRIDIEDIDHVKIKMGFPLAFQFIESAYSDDSDFYRNPSKSNPLVDDVFQTKMEISKRQKL